MFILRFFIATWVGRIIGLVVSLAIIAGVLVSIVLVLAATGGPGDCTAGGTSPIVISDANAASFQQKWDAFSDMLDAGSPASVTFNESEASSRANAWAKSEDINFEDDIRICIHADFGEATATFGGSFFSMGVRVKGSVELPGAHPKAHVDDVEVGNVPGLFIGPLDGLVEDAIQEALNKIDLGAHTYTVTLTEGQAKIDGVP
ncbi:MAG: hypothetical protein WBD55_10030 [Dehalococcoidia bacterium]